MAEYLDMAFKLWADFQAWTPTSIQLYTMMGLSLACAFIVSAFSSAARLFTVPISFIALFFAGNFTNFLGHNVFISGLTDMQKTIGFTILGDCVVAVILLAMFKVSTRR